MDAWADGLNFYLADASRREAARDHAVRAVDGAVVHRRQHRRRHRANQSDAARERSTAKIPRVKLSEHQPERVQSTTEPTGSNGIAIAPANTARRNALLLINPHTSFFFRAEAQMMSEEGPECLRRGDLGPVLRLSGLQRPRRLDAHVERRRQHRRVPRDDREEGRRLRLRYGTRSVPSRRRASRCRTRPRPAWRSGSSPSTARTTARSCAKRTASGSAFG